MVKGGYSENLLIPAATLEAIKSAVAVAVKTNRLWLVNGTISVLGDEVPSEFLNKQAIILAPPTPILATNLLPAKLEQAWKDGETTGHLIHAALSALKGEGKPLPWVIVKRALEVAFQLGLLVRTLDSSPWPCDLGCVPVP